jgi:hypothetical protein
VDQIELLRRTVEILDREQIVYMLVGSIASASFGEPRMTQDIDVVVEVSPDQAALLCAAFSADEFYVSEVAAREAATLNSQFNVVHFSSGNKIDFMVARRDAWGKAQLERRQLVPIIGEVTGYVASPEDTILGKLVYYNEGGSEKHLRDIAGVFKVCGASLDRNYIEKWVGELGLGASWDTLVAHLEEN